MHVQQLYHSLSKSPEVAAVQGIIIRHFEDATDIGRWVELMDIAFKNLNPPMRPWTEADFKTRIMEQPGWSPAHLFLACDRENQVAGSVSLKLIAPGGSAQAYTAETNEIRSFWMPETT